MSRKQFIGFALPELRRITKTFSNILIIYHNEGDVNRLLDLIPEMGILLSSVRWRILSLKQLEDAVAWIDRSVDRRLRDGYNGCKHLGSDGYCGYWYDRVQG